MLIHVHSQHFSLLFIIFMSIFCLEKMLMCTLFEWGMEMRVCIRVKTLTCLDGPLPELVMISTDNVEISFQIYCCHFTWFYPQIWGIW